MHFKNIQMIIAHISVCILCLKLFLFILVSSFIYVLLAAIYSIVVDLYLKGSQWAAERKVSPVWAYSWTSDEQTSGMVLWLSEEVAVPERWF